MNNLTPQQQVEEWYQECKKIFELDSTSPSGIRWKINRSHMKAGDVAGSPHKKVYWKVNVLGTKHMVHHIVAALGDVKGWREMREELTINPKSTKYMMNHLRKDKLNIPSALQVTDARGNQQDRQCHRDGKLVGANYDSRSNHYRSLIRLNGTVTYLGMFIVPSEAHNAYKLALTMHQAAYPVDTIKETCREYAVTARANHDL